MSSTQDKSRGLGAMLEEFETKTMTELLALNKTLTQENRAMIKQVGKITAAYKEWKKRVKNMPSVLVSSESSVCIYTEEDVQLKIKMEREQAYQEGLLKGIQRERMNAKR